MNIDLSFTKDPAWISARTKIWAPIEADLKSGLRKKDLESLKDYFFTGIIPEGRHMNDRPKLIYFPLTTPEGWNYVFQHLARDGATLYKSEYYWSINDSLVLLGDMDVRLRYFDYFHGDIHQSEVATAVPVSPKGEKLFFKADESKKFEMLCANVLKFLKRGVREIVFYRREVFFSLLKHIDSNLLVDGGDLKMLLSMVMELVQKYQPSADIFNPEMQLEFVEDFHRTIRQVESGKVVSALWLEINNSGGD